MARPRKDSGQILAERAKDLRALIEHFCITRLLQCEGYHTAGQFNIRRFEHQHEVVMGWRKKSVRSKRAIYKAYHTYRNRHNEVMGIPHQLLNAVLGRCEGKRLQLETVMKMLGSSTWKTIKGGTKSVWDAKKKESKVLWTWSRKIVPSSMRLWKSMLEDPRYLSMDTAPNMTERTRKLVKAYESIPALAEKFVSINAPDEAVDKAMQKWNYPSWTIELVLKRMQTIRRVEEKKSEKMLKMVNQT